MNVVAEIARINERELALGVPFEASWHQKYRDSAWVYVGGLPFELTEGDVLCVLSQFGEIADVNLVRDATTGKSRGFAFLKYEDQRSTVLAVDNLNGARLLERTLRVDHVLQYKLPKEIRDRDNEKNDHASDDEIPAEAEDDAPLRGQPGHAYEGKELAGSFDLSKGQNVFAAPKETKEERKKRKRSEKHEKEARKQAHKLEKKQKKLFEEIQKRRQQQRAMEQAQASNENGGGAAPSASGWRGRLEPSSTNH